MGGFLDYVPGESLLHRLNPLTKFFLSLVLCVSCFLNGSPLFVFGIILVNLGISASAGVADRTFRLLKGLLKFALFLFLVQVLFVRDGNIILPLPAGLVITDRGVIFSLLFSLRLVAATMPLALMLSVTKMSDLTSVLVDRLKIPYRYTFALTTAIRFIPIFTNEMADIMEAQIARGVDFDTKNFFRKIKLLMPLCVPLLISSVKRIENGAVAAELRGFNRREKNSGYRKYPFAAKDLAAVLFGAAVIAASVLL